LLDPSSSRYLRLACFAAISEAFDYRTVFEELSNFLASRLLARRFRLACRDQRSLEFYTDFLVPVKDFSTSLPLLLPAPYEP